MFARLSQIDAEIADAERKISLKNEIIIAGLEKGVDTLHEEEQVCALFKTLQLKKAARHKLLADGDMFRGATAGALAGGRLPYQGLRSPLIRNAASDGNGSPSTADHLRTGQVCWRLRGERELTGLSYHTGE